jgi:hypothetical protein
LEWLDVANIRLQFGAHDLDSLQLDVPEIACELIVREGRYHSLNRAGRGSFFAGPSKLRLVPAAVTIAWAIGGRRRVRIMGGNFKWIATRAVEPAAAAAATALFKSYYSSQL